MKKNMKKVLLTALIILSVGTVGCGSKTDEDVTIIGGADGPTSIFLASKTEEEITDDLALAIPGTWQTASVGYIDGEDMQPEYYVQFTEAEVNYGHMKDGAFALDHSDKISEIEKMLMTNIKLRRSLPVEYSIHIRLLKVMQIYLNIMRPGMKRISQKCIEAERH